MVEQPIRLAMKLGVSRAKTTSLPRRKSVNAETASMAAASVSGVAMIQPAACSGRIEKCVPKKRRRMPGGMPDAIDAIGQATGVGGENGVRLRSG